MMIRSLTASSSAALPRLRAAAPAAARILSPHLGNTSFSTYLPRASTSASTTTAASSSSSPLSSAAELHLPPLRVEAAPMDDAKTVPTKREKVSRILKARKAAITLTPTAITHIAALLLSPTPRLVRIGVRNKGCAGMSYHLDYVEKPDRFDEVVEQGGVKVVVDSKALFSVIGSEMDWVEDALGAKFVFKNPNSVDTCGCGESFTV